MSQEIDDTKKYDLNSDGNYSEQELFFAAELRKAKADERKQRHQRNMAWFALLSIVVFTALLFTPIISVERVDSLSSILDVFYITMAAVVGAFMGVTAWMSRGGGR